MTSVKVGSFNVWGIDGKDVAATVAAAHDGFDWSEAWALAFQEVWFKHQLAAVDAAWKLTGGASSKVQNVFVETAPSGWTRLYPDAPPLSRPLPLGPQLELTSGLCLLVRGTVRECFFHRYEEDGFIPDKFASKGLLAALVDQPDGTSATFVCTHLHNNDNDRGANGRARFQQLDELAGWLKRMIEIWHAPVYLLGDFNIDARSQSPVEMTLYDRLVSLAGVAWNDLNLVAHAGKVVPTLRDADETLDHHLASRRPDTPVKFVTLPIGSGKSGSDHRLTVSAW